MLVNVPLDCQLATGLFTFERHSYKRFSLHSTRMPILPTLQLLLSQIVQIMKKTANIREYKVALISFSPLLCVSENVENEVDNIDILVPWRDREKL